jgi:hypothetical protein
MKEFVCNDDRPPNIKSLPKKDHIEAVSEEKKENR